MLGEQPTTRLTLNLPHKRDYLDLGSSSLTLSSWDHMLLAFVSPFSDSVVEVTDSYTSLYFFWGFCFVFL